MGSTGGLGAVRLEVDVFSSPPVIPIVPRFLQNFTLVSVG